ncbi:MAG: helicase HerA domain-containing protein [Candidatus Bathyarchaeia archaeon]
MGQPSQSKDLTRYTYRELTGKKTLIIGDVSTGKTVLTANLLKEALETEDPREITLLDMAPERTLHGGKVIGGRITDLVKLPSTVRVLKPARIKPPRHSAKSRDELLRLVEENRIAIEEILNIYLDEATPTLFINDLSLYFQSGRWRKVFEAMGRSVTFIANAYYGETLKEDFGTGVSTVEKRLVTKLSRRIDVLIRL